MCGVYMIRCLRNGMIYIGGTTQPFEARFAGHRNSLRSGSSTIRLLQAAYDLYGEGALEFIPLKEFPPEEVATREREAIERLKPQLNISCNRGRDARSTPEVEFGGERLSVTQLAARYKLGPATIRARLARGLVGPDLVAPPHRTKRKEYTRRK